MAQILRTIPRGLLPLALLSPVARPWCAASFPLNIAIGPTAESAAISPYICGFNQDLSGAPDFPQIKVELDRVHALGLSEGSTDAAVLVRLSRGSYTSSPRVRNHPPGVALIELYQVNPPGS